MNIIAQQQRSFGGKTENFVDKAEQAFEKRHLTAYLRGAKRFRMGYELTTSIYKTPKWFDVKEIWS